jgi:hypothetical protein
VRRGAGLEVCKTCGYASNGRTFMIMIASPPCMQ